MYRFVYAKFHQNPELQQKLISTGNAVLAENTTDTFWATGIRNEQQMHTLFNLGKPWPGSNHMGKILEEVRATLQHGPMLHSVLVVGDSLVKNLPCETHYDLVSWSGVGVIDVFRLAAVLAHTTVKVVVLLAGTNDLPKFRPWEEGSLHSDGAPLRRNPSAVRSRFCAALHYFFSLQPDMRVVVCEILPRFCDAPMQVCNSNKQSELSQIQRGLEIVNRMLAQDIVPQFLNKGFSVQLMPTFEHMYDVKYFQMANLKPSLHLFRGFSAFTFYFVCILAKGVVFGLRCRAVAAGLRPLSACV